MTFHYVEKTVLTRRAHVELTDELCLKIGAELINYYDLYKSGTMPAEIKEILSRADSIRDTLYGKINPSFPTGRYTVYLYDELLDFVKDIAYNNLEDYEEDFFDSDWEIEYDEDKIKFDD